jgi:hypothetical protein
MHIDVMTKMRGVEAFESLWERRTTLADEEGVYYELLGIHDLVKAKKTQRDKDWPMIRRLVEAHYAEYKNDPTEERIKFWLLESRTPDMLIELVADHPDEAHKIANTRRLLNAAFAASHSDLEQELLLEQNAEILADKIYWAPLKRELETLRRQLRSNRGSSP